MPLSIGRSRPKTGIYVIKNIAFYPENVKCFFAILETERNLW